VFSPKDWNRKRAIPDSFAARVNAGPKLMIVGDLDDVP
jgi:hypothetical protein